MKSSIDPTRAYRKDSGEQRKPYDLGKQIPFRRGLS